MRCLSAARSPAADPFAEVEVPPTERRHLRQMRDAQDLVASTQDAQTLGHPASGRPADPGIDLVEEQGRYAMEFYSTVKTAYTLP